MKHRIMVIDDRWIDREEIYHKVLDSDYEIVPVIKGSQLFDTIETEQVDAYIVDIVLSGWTDKNGQPQQVLPVLEKIGKEWPILLVSNQYSNLLENGSLTHLINSILDKKIDVNFFIWSDFSKAASSKDLDNTETIKSKIKLDILRNKKITQDIAARTFDFAIICALGEELKPFLDTVTVTENKQLENIHLRIGTLKTKSGKTLRFISAQLEEMGNTDSAIVTTRIVSEYRLSHVFMIGVCGGREGKAKIGDIIVPHEIIAYQNGKINEQGFQINTGVAKSKGNLKGAIENQCDNIIKKIHKKYVKEKISEKKIPEIGLPEIIFDPMASGSMVINRNGELDTISKETAKPKLCAVDMESFSIFRICEILDIKASVIKSVMDLTSKKSDAYKHDAAFLAANFLFELIHQEKIKF